MKISLTFYLLGEAVVILAKEKIAEADQMTVVIAIARRSTTEEETVRMTPVVVAEAQEEIIEAEGIQTEKEAANLVSTETTDLQRAQVEAVGAAVTISVNRVTIILANK
jgi:hypothetical protein